MGFGSGPSPWRPWRPAVASWRLVGIFGSRLAELLVGPIDGRVGCHVDSSRRPCTCGTFYKTRLSVTDSEVVRLPCMHFQIRSAPCGSWCSPATMPRMWQRLLPFLLIVGTFCALADDGPSPRPFRPTLAAHRTILADPDCWALIRGRLSERTQARSAAASRSAHNARLPTPDDSAILADAHWLPGLHASARLAASRVQSGPARFLIGHVSRAPPGLSTPLF